MDENAVIESVCNRLQAQGCEVTQRLTTTQHGVDIVAHNPENGQQFYIEAKGATSSKEGSPGFGKPFDQRQIFNRVAKGVFTSLQLRAKHPDRESAHVILALPDAPRFRSYITPVLQSLQEAGIKVWFEPIQGASSS